MRIAVFDFLTPLRTPLAFTIYRGTRLFSEIVYKNRNPRSLELLGLSAKRKGWEFQSPRVDYWHKVCLQKSAHHTSGMVIHSSGSTAVTASTREPAIQKHLYSCVDVSAAENIGHILAYRCQQCGLINLFFDTIEWPLTNETVKAFYDALLEGGISLEEPAEVKRPEPLGVDYDSLTEEQKRAMYPSLIETLRDTPDWDSLPYPYSLRPGAGGRKLKQSYQVLSKVRQGMVWDPFYKRMVLPRNKAAWQHEYEERLRLEAERPKDLLLTEKDHEVKTIVPSKWQLD